jgi:hypothetical protein
MVKRRIVQALIVLVLLLACRWIPGTLETPGTQEAHLVQIGYFHSVYLRYNTDEWEKRNEFPDQPQNNKGEPVEALQHRDIAGCILHDNLGRGTPPSWERQVSNRVIGSLEYHVEAWTDTAAQTPVLRVYQYPAGEPGVGTRIELAIDQRPDECIQSAEAVLVASSDLISQR